jgi:hypothetical protein
MNAKLYESGTMLAEVDATVTRGKQHFTDVTGLGSSGRERIPGRKDPDRCSFLLPAGIHVDTKLDHVLEFGDGTKRRLLIERATFGMSPSVSGILQ